MAKVTEPQVTEPVEPTEPTEPTEDKDYFNEWDEPDGEENESDEPEGEESKDGDPEEPAEPAEPEQPKIDHEANARARAIRKESMAAIDKQAKGLGFDSVAEMFKALQQAKENSLKQAVEDGDENAIDELANYKAAQAVAEERARFAAQLQAQETVQGHINEFNAEYPQYAVKTFADIEKLPNAERILTLLNKADIEDMTLTDAFLIANKADVINGKISAAQQAVRNDGKSHLKTNGGSSGADTTPNIPSNVLRDYTSYGYTEKEARARYAKAMKGKNNG